MKKLLIPISLIIAGLTYVMIANEKAESEKGDLQLTNLEILTQTETDYTMMCYNSVEYTGSTNLVLYCGTCSYKYGCRGFGGMSRCK